MKGSGEDVDVDRAFMALSRIGASADGPTAVGDVELLQQLVRRWHAEPATVAAPIGSLLTRAADARWHSGWQPEEVAAHLGRSLKTVHLSLLAATVRVDARRYRTSPAADPAWLEQVDGLPGREVPSSGDLPWRAVWAHLEGLRPGEAIVTAAVLWAALVQAPRLRQLVDPPHTWGQSASKGPHVPTGLDPKVLARVRALLAKAESTTFPAEADALTAKAQELIAAHAIDRAALESGGREHEQTPVEVRIWLDSPYIEPKGQLLFEVAGATRCQTVFDSGLGCSTVFGMAADVEATELLFTSLLVQATNELVTVGSAAKGHARSRSRGFRRSFLYAYAFRIGERLREATTAVVEEAAAGNAALLPVLASQHDRIEDAVRAAFPRLRSKRLSISDGAGWAAGKLAADRANLAPGGAIGRSA
jgi:hypothetical protein